MTLPIQSLALYTTIYPGVQPYLREWHKSVQAQTDQDYQIWIGLDALGSEAVKEAIGSSIKAEWIEAAFGDTPAQIRQQALSQIVQTCDGVVLVDSDDTMHPSRVAAAREALQTSELAGCALRLVDHKGQYLSSTFGLPPQTKIDDVFPRNNVFGLSNSAFRSDLLRRCLPIPKDAVLVDWFLSTKAWLLGAKLFFDPLVRMDYRQHGTNMAKVRAPFNVGQVAQDTVRVSQHFRIIRALPAKEFIPERLRQLEKLADDVELFYRQVVLKPSRLETYVRKLNELDLAPLWWSCVANASLNQMWAS